MDIACHGGGARGRFSPDLMRRSSSGARARGRTDGLLTSIGLGIVVAGVLIVSNVWKTPTYNVILAWDPEAMPADWEAGRRRYFTINWIQLAVTWAAFALFLVALVSL